MARTTALGNASRELRAAVRSGELSSLFRSSEALIALMLDAITSARSEDLKSIEKDFANAHAMMLLLNDLEPEIGPTAAAWMLKAEASVAALARRLVPPILSHDRSGTVAEKVLLALKDSALPGVANNQLARMCATNEATIARALSSLRSEGLVESWKSGRYVMNRITDLGSSHATSLSWRSRRGRELRAADEATYDDLITLLSRGEAGRDLAEIAL